MFGSSLENFFSGLRIIEDKNMVDPVEDWSQVRSPSRARRRMRYGYPQRVRTVYVPKTEAYRMGDIVVMHPIMAAQLRASMPSI